MKLSLFKTSFAKKHPPWEKNFFKSLFFRKCRRLQHLATGKYRKNGRAEDIFDGYSCTNVAN